MRITTTLLIVVVMTTSVRGDEPLPPILPSEVQAALEKNATLFSNILITGERSRRLLAPAETVLKTLKTLETEADLTQALRFQLRFQGPLFRESIEYLPGGNTYTSGAIYEVSYDGTKFILGYKRLKDLASSNVQIYTPSIATAYGKFHDRPDCLANMEFWYLRETGFIGPQTIATLGQPVESIILNAADHGQIVSVSEAPGGNEKMIEVIIERPEPWQSSQTYDIETHEAFLELKNGSDILQMRMEREFRQLAGKQRVIRFWLNSARGYAVEEKWELRKETGETMFHTKNSDFVQVAPHGVWMPKRCVVDSHTYHTVPVFISPDPLFETVIQMDQCEPGNFDDDEFRIWYDEPGVVVSDWTSPKATLEESDQYMVAASIDDLPNKASGSRRWLIMLNILFIAGWLGWWLYSRSRTKGTEA